MKKLVAATLVIFTVLIAGAWYLAASQPLKQNSPTPTVQMPEAGPITVQGTMVCLPHKNTSGQQTLECAYGLKKEDGLYFALRDTDPTYQNLSRAPMNTLVTVTGEFTPSPDSKYQDVGVIAVTKIEALIADGSIFGTVTLGPSCPVQTNPPDPDCTDRLYQTNLVVTTINGAEVIKEFQSDHNGRFRVEIPAGEYAIRSATIANSLPDCASAGTITVSANLATEAKIFCDTGIR